ncbi:MAG: selenide, water dikinase SelD [Cyanobacteria bacterium P01_C01_bin.120]
MRPVQPITKDLVLVGGGHTHAIVLRQFGMKPLPGVRLTLITNLVDTPYSGMLPCHISGLYDFDESHIDLRPLSRFANCQLLMDRAVGIDPQKQQVICAHHPPVTFDVLSIDTGSTPATVAVPGARAYTIPAKPVPDLLFAWNAWLSEVRHGSARPLSFAIVGGGVGGVELTLNMQIRLWKLLDELGRSRSELTIHLFHRGEELANGRNRSTRRRLHRRFVERGISLHLQESVCAIEPVHDHQRRVRCESGLTIDCDRVFWVTNAAAPGWIQGTGLATDEAGFLLVEDTLQSCSHANIFAAGDVATMKNHARPKAGVFAVRQGSPLFHNLQAYLKGESLRPFTPQKQYLNIIDTGDGSAIASRGPFTFESPLMRAWKHRIDSKFMRLFSDFPSMTQAVEGREEKSAIAPDFSSSMYCAGCGSKVSSRVLHQTLARLRQEHGEENLLTPNSLSQGNRESLMAADPGDVSSRVLIGLLSPDDAAVVQVPPAKLMVHTVDFFNALVDDPFVFGQIVVKHCLNDLYAMGAEPQTVLAIATLPHGAVDKQTETLFHLLSGVQKSLMATLTPLVGGHTTEGEQLALGLACNGLVSDDQILRKGDMQVGDALILTQPLGTGTLFAADMRKQAKGRWIENAIAHMIQPSAAAIRCLRQHGVTACTDVTGFGLLGHLLEMVQAAQLGVDLDLQNLPVLDGALMTLQQGIVSSLQPQNLHAARSLRHAASYANRPDYAILFDPQTAGGLLAAVPPTQADRCIAQLRALGYTAATRIGTVVPSVAGQSPITIKAW